LIEFDNEVTKKVYECLLVFFDRWKFLPVRNISAFYDLGGDLATDYCRQLTSCFAKAHTVGDVCHRYDENNSIKSAERERRRQKYFFQSGIFLPSMTWDTFVWAVTLVRRSLSADLMELFSSYR
jgi:hypothetical protein